MTTFYATIRPTPEVLDCGHVPQPSQYTRGYEVNPQDGKTLCPSCMANATLSRMVTLPVGERVNGLFLSGLTAMQPIQLKTMREIMLTDKVLIVNRKLRGGKRVSFRFLLMGRVWAGYCNQWGGKVVCWKTKLMDLSSNLWKRR